MPYKISDLTEVSTPAATDLFEMEDVGGNSFKISKATIFTDVSISLSAADAVGLSIEAASAQTANIFEINTNGGSDGDILSILPGVITSAIKMEGASSTSPAIQFDENGTEGNAVFNPRKNDQTTGYGGGTNTLALIIDGESVLTVDDDDTALNTSLLIWDVDNNQLERVSVGAADSGGSGFKVLRIPN